MSLDINRDALNRVRTYLDKHGTKDVGYLGGDSTASAIAKETGVPKEKLRSLAEISQGDETADGSRVLVGVDNLSIKDVDKLILQKELENIYQKTGKVDKEKAFLYLREYGGDLKLTRKIVEEEEKLWNFLPIKHEVVKSVEETSLRKEFSDTYLIKGRIVAEYSGENGLYEPPYNNQAGVYKDTLTMNDIRFLVKKDLLRVSSDPYDITDFMIYLIDKGFSYNDARTLIILNGSSKRYTPYYRLRLVSYFKEVCPDLKALNRVHENPSKELERAAELAVIDLLNN